MHNYKTKLILKNQSLRISRKLYIVGGITIHRTILSEVEAQLFAWDKT